MSSGDLNKAMILAAGYGTRLKPLTDTIPKALIPYKSRPMIAGVIEKLKSAGINDIVVNTHYLHTQVEEYFEKNDFGVKITLVHEPEILGTGGAIKNARKFLEDSGNFLVYNVDVVSDLNINEMFQHHLKYSPLATLAVKTRETTRPLLMDSCGYLTGRIINGEWILSKGVDKSELIKTAFCGIHIVSGDIFNFFDSENNFDIITQYLSMVKQNIKVVCYDINNCFWDDLGKLSALEE